MQCHGNEQQLTDVFMQTIQSHTIQAFAAYTSVLQDVCTHTHKACMTTVHVLDLLKVTVCIEHVPSHHTCHSAEIDMHMVVNNRTEVVHVHVHAEHIYALSHRDIVCYFVTVSAA